MFSGVSALLFRSLREDALLLRYHMLRGGIVFFLMLNVVQANESMFNNASPGLELFRGLLMNNILLISLAGIGYFATPIAEEKEEETLGLLLMAGVSRLGILLGKSTSRLIITLVLGLIEVPFLLLAITLGGVTQHQIWCGFALVASFTIFVANLGLLFSVVCSTTASASRSMLIFLLVYFIIPPLLLPLWVSITSLGTTPSPVAQFLLTLANAGCQIFIATHDYLLPYELSLSVEYPVENQPAPPMKFFTLMKGDNGTTIESGETMYDLPYDAIMEGHLQFHEKREQLQRDSLKQ